MRNGDPWQLTSMTYALLIVIMAVLIIVNI
jgi:hypothetical protein